MFVGSGTGELKKVLVSKPVYLEPAPINEIAAKWKDTSLDKDKMLAEHCMLVEAYEKNGVEVIFLEPDKNMPNAVFSRDFGGCIKEGYILGQFKLPLRYQETVFYEKRMKELQIPKVCTIERGLFEGGDFAYIRSNLIALGMADRTDMAGCKELAEKLLPLGYEILPVPIDRRYLHLDMCFNLVEEHLAVAYLDGLPEVLRKKLTELDIEVIEVPEESIFEHGCNLQSLGNHRVLSLSQNQKVNESLEAKGMRVIELNVTEILKAGGGPHCMSFPLLRI